MNKFDSTDFIKRNKDNITKILSYLKNNLELSNGSIDFLFFLEELSITERQLVILLNNLHYYFYLDLVIFQGDGEIIPTNRKVNSYSINKNGIKLLNQIERGYYNEK